MNQPNPAWRRLTALARQAPPPPTAAMPLGFDTRVVARWKSDSGASRAVLWEWLGVRAVACAVAVLVFSAAANRSVFRAPPPDARELVDAVLEQGLRP
jgi:hypothetical protein